MLKRNKPYYARGLWEDIYQLLVGVGAAMSFVLLAVHEEDIWVRVGFGVIAIVLIFASVFRVKAHDE